MYDLNQAITDVYDAIYKVTADKAEVFFQHTMQYHKYFKKPQEYREKTLRPQTIFADGNDSDLFDSDAEIDVITD